MQRARGVSITLDGRPWVISWGLIVLTAVCAAALGVGLCAGYVWNTRGLTDVRAEVVTGPQAVRGVAGEPELRPAVISYRWEGQLRRGTLQIDQAQPGEEVPAVVNAEGETVQIVQNRVADAWVGGVMGGLFGATAFVSAVLAGSLVASSWQDRRTRETG